MKRSIKQILKRYQQIHVMNLEANLSKKHICFDSSSTGVGKTYSAVALAKHMKMKIFVVCPKTIMSLWLRIILDVFKIELVGISNYELLIKCKYFDKTRNSKVCPYIEKTEDKSSYKWNLPPNTLIVFDEVHRCCNPNAYVGQLLLSLRHVYSASNPLLLISATICDGPAKFKLFSVLLKWCDSFYNTFNWLEPTYNPKAASKIINDRLLLYNNICKVDISDLGDEFKKNNVNADYYDVKASDATAIDTLHQSIINSLKKVPDKDHDKPSGFTAGLRERQKIELLKVSIFVDLTQQYLDNNFSVIIFVNFTETLKLLMKELKTNCVIYGEQTINQRLSNIEDFVEDRERVIICNIQSGGDSISLNDKYGKFQRVSLISPPLSAIKLIQACGRNSRVDSKTISFNQIIYANTNVERRLCNRLKGKCSMYASITDDDMAYDEVDE